jgi:hypothetical protein
MQISRIIRQAIAHLRTIADQHERRAKQRTEAAPGWPR